MSKINVFTKDGCPKCDHVKQILKDVNTKIIIFNIATSPNALDWMNAHDFKTLPVLQIYNDTGQELIVTFGFTKGNIANKFKQHTGGELFG
jgi:glutaredoxin